MADSTLIPVSALAVIMALEKVIPLVTSRKNGRVNGPVKCDAKELGESLAAVLSKLVDNQQETKTSVDEIKAWHNVRDETGTFVWYGRPAMKDIAILIKSVEQQTGVMLQLLDVIKSKI